MDEGVPRGASRWASVAVFAGAAVVVAGAVYAVASSPSGPPVVAAPTDAAAFATAPPAPDLDRLVVAEGDAVRATGRVEALPGRPPRFCAPAPVSGGGAARECVFGVGITGLEPVPDGALVALTGVWRSGALAVTARDTPAVRPEVEAVPLPCAPPASGWRSPGTADRAALQRYVTEEHPERFRMPSVAYPASAEVVVVEVVKGDVTAAGNALRSRYAGNLCVVDAAGRMSLADQKSLRERVDRVVLPLMADPANGVYAVGGADVVRVELVAVTPALRERLAQVDDAVELRPWLVPVQSTPR
ncbi:hypothetical protein GCM10010492_04840 [Saccharothrix mutabilis subsp. mutabilis]|uniref:Uncharacterized protein n=1 Tax=Saccharothrix mutabilis subsp. mutabilis TaxID=66855 RepID=A0ABN0T2H3_9PSEU